MRTIKSLEKGLDILTIIAGFPKGARVKEISDRMEEPVSNITLFLNSLVNSGFVMKNTLSGRYFLSHKISDLAEKSARGEYSFLKECAAEGMQTLLDEYNENVLLAVLAGQEMHIIEKLQSGRRVRVYLNADSYYPPHVTAAGKAILACQAEAELVSYLENCLYQAYTDKTQTNPGVLRQELEETRARGYAFNRGEYDREIMAVAAPIIVYSRVVASLSLQFPYFRYSEEELSRIGNRILDLVEDIQSRIINMDVG